MKKVFEMSEKERVERALKYHAKVTEMVLKAVFSERGDSGKDNKNSSR